MKINWPALGLSGLWLAGALTAVPYAAAQDASLAPAVAATQQASISAVAVTQPGSQTTVRISGTGELRYQTSRLDSPSRLVLDFADTRLAMKRYKVASEFAPVVGVRLGQPNPGQSRIVIDLAGDVPYTAAQDGSTITVSFAAAAAAAGTSPVVHPVRTANARKIAVTHASDMPLPAWLTEKNSALARPATQPDAPPGTLSPVPQNPAPADTQAPAGQAPEKKYTGDPISVNLKDVDLKDFFRLIHEISGLNVVLDPAVRGTVTLVLDEVPWDQGLDIVLRNNGLTKEIDGNVLRIATQETLRREVDARRDLAKAQADAIEPVTVTRVLSYSQAGAMVNTVKRFLTPRGEVIADQRSNTLIIRDIPSSIPKIDNLLRQIDRKSQQVEIDARVVQTSRSFAHEIGTQFGFSAPTGVTGNTAFGGVTGITSFLSPIIHSVATPFATGGAGSAQIPLNSNLPANGPNSGFSFATQGHNYAIDFILTLMESRGVGKILSEPKGITQNNEKLTVKQGQQVPIQTNINNTISTQYVDAVLKLEVTPQITAEGTVFLDVDVENTQIDKAVSVQGEPGLDTQSTQTKVLVNDGGTIVIGGVVVTNQNTTISQVPLLGSVPLIGNLFRHTAISISTQELMFFVTPRILPG
jgi:type IV pilus assembly protein PilQ